MFGSNRSFFSRRELAKGAMVGGASLLFDANASASSNPQRGKTFLNVRKLGAKGDGKTDDTKALQRALDAAAQSGGSVFVPPGIYLTGELHLPSDIALIGVPAWNYENPGGSVLRLLNGDSSCLLNISNGRGATIDGLSLDGRGLGKNVHGISTDRTKHPPYEDSIRIERCRIAHFSGDGAHMVHIWCYSVRHSMLAFNHGDGLNMQGHDGFILDNWFSGNGRAGFAGRDVNSAVTFTANRVEWNAEENLLVSSGNNYQITGNFFDRAGTCGIALRGGDRPNRHFTITGNYIRSSGKNVKNGSHESAQISLDWAQGVTFTGNDMDKGNDDSDRRWSPDYGIVYRRLESCVICNNVLYDGAMKQLIVDLDGHGDGVIVKDNPGCVFLPDA